MPQCHPRSIAGLVCSPMRWPQPSPRSNREWHQAFHQAPFPGGGASHWQPTVLQDILELFHAPGADGMAGINGFRFHGWPDEYLAVEIVQEFQAPVIVHRNCRRRGPATSCDRGIQVPEGLHLPGRYVASTKPMDSMGVGDGTGQPGRTGAATRRSRPFSTSTHRWQTGERYRNHKVTMVMTMA